MYLTLREPLKSWFHFVYDCSCLIYRNCDHFLHKKWWSSMRKTISLFGRELWGICWFNKESTRRYQESWRNPRRWTMMFENRWMQRLLVRSLLEIRSQGLFLSFSFSLSIYILVLTIDLSLSQPWSEIFKSCKTRLVHLINWRIKSNVAGDGLQFSNQHVAGTPSSRNGQYLNCPSPTQS
jgi:hypothetical protein